jgi:hypothetical protein
MINLIILREHRFPAVPSTITERVFGPEMIVDDKGHVLARALVHGGKGPGLRSLWRHPESPGKQDGPDLIDH